MMSSLIPSEKYSCSISPLILMNGRTAIAVRSSVGSNRRRGCRRLIRTYTANKAKALTGDRAQQALIPAGVLDCLSHRIDAASQRRFRDNAPVPHFVEQFILADDAVAVLKEIEQQIENLRFYRNAFACAAQFALRDIKHLISKDKSHLLNPRPGG